MTTKTKCVRNILLGGTMSFALPFLRSDWSITSFCDGFAVVGVLFLSYVGLQFLRNQNAFFGLRFIGKRIKSYFFPFMGRGNEQGSVSVKEGQKQSIDRGILAVGGIYLGMAVIFLFFI